MTQGTQVTLTVGALHYPVALLVGSESPSQPYEFTLTLFQPRSLNVGQLLERDAILTIVAATGQRRIFGMIADISQEQSHGVSTVNIVMTFSSRLASWQDETSALGFPQRDSVEFLQDYGRRHGCEAHDFDTREITRRLVFPYRLQVPEENDLSFFQRQLARSGIYFWSNTEAEHESWIFSDDGMPGREFFVSDCVLTVNETLAPPCCEFTDQIEINQQLERISSQAGHDRKTGTLTRHGLGAPDQSTLDYLAKCHWQSLEVKRLTQCVKISIPSLGLFDLIELTSVPHAKFQKGRVIHITHHADEHHYWQSVTLIPHDTQYRDAIPEHPAVPTAWTGKIDHWSDQLEITEGGKYYTRLRFDQSDYAPTLSMPPLRHLAPVGWHAPLLPGTRLLLSAIDGNPDLPLITAILPNENQIHSNDYRWQSAIGSEILLRDDHGIRLQATQMIECDLKRDIFKIEAVTGNLEESASILKWKSEANMQLQSDVDYLLEAQTAHWKSDRGNLHWQSGQKMHLQSETLSAETKRNWQIASGDHLNWQQQDQLQITAEMLLLSAESDFIVDQVERVTFVSHDQLVMQMGSTFLRLSANGLIECQSKSMLLQSEGSIEWNGNVSYLESDWHQTILTQPLELLTKLWHEPWKTRHLTSIQGLHWKENWGLWDAPHIARVTVLGYPEGTPVLFSVYACNVPLHQSVSGTELGQMDDATDRVLVSQQHLNLPTANASKCVEFTWYHQKTTFQKWSGHIVFRFHVQVADQSSDQLSTPLQLLGSLNIHCKERVRQGAELHIEVDDTLIAGGEGTPPFFAPRVLIENQQCTLTRVPFYTPITASLYEPGLSAVDALNLAQQQIRAREIFTDQHREPSLSATLWLIPSERNDLELGVLMPPVIVNSRHDAKPAEDVSARLRLTDEELQYFLENGNNLFIFIHGYNVSFERGQEWLSCVEKNLNQAAGFTDDYHQYTRLVLFAWEGDPTLRADFYSAMNQSFRDSEKLAYFIGDLRQRAPQLKINLMAHSLGNSLIVHALDTVAKRTPAVINHVFLWQAALPRNVLNTHSMTTKNPWHLPDAHAGAKRWSILFSGNDCLLGPIRGEKLFSLSQSRINQYKPFDELLLGCFCKYLDLNCLYSAAVQLGLSVSQLLESKELDRAYLAWRMQNPDRTHDAHGRPLQATLAEQANLPDSNVLNTGFIIKTDIKLYFAMVRIYAVLAKLGLVNMGKLRENMITILELGATNMLNPAVMVLECLGELFHRDARSFMKHFQALRGSQSFIQLCDWYGRALTFIHLMYETTMTTQEVAMGYAGLDSPDPILQSKRNQGWIKEFDLTEVIYAHSDMKVPRPAILERAYRDIVIQSLRESGGFGHYFP